MKYSIILQLALLMISSPLLSFSQDDALLILEKSSKACQALQSVKYYINKVPLDASSNRPTFKGTITLAKDTLVENSIFNEYLYHSDIDIWINSKKALNVVTAYDGENLYVEKKKELIKYEDPSPKTIMSKLGFELYLLIYNGFVSPDGLQVLFSRDLTQLPDTVINGVPSYHIKAITEIPTSPGSDEMIKSISDWFFSKHDNMPVGYQGANYFSTYQILERDHEVDKNDFTIISDTDRNVSNKTNKDVQEENLLEIGSAVPDWTSMTLKESELTLSGLRGKVVVLDFWGTWCAPCIKSMPNIQKIHEKYDDVEVIGIAVKDEVNKIKNLIKKKEFTYTIIPNGTDIAKTYNVAEYPTLYILNTKGEVVYREKGFNAKGFEEWSNIIETIKKEH